VDESNTEGVAGSSVYAAQIGLNTPLGQRLLVSESSVSGMNVVKKGRGNRAVS